MSHQRNSGAHILNMPRILDLAVMAAGLFCGCTRSDTPESRSAVLPELRLGYFANLTHAQAILGVASGEFASAIAPTRLSTSIFNAGPSLVEALFVGELDVGYIGPGPAINAYVKSGGRGIRVIAGACANGVVIVASAKSNIHQMTDLKGRRVATPQLGNTQDISARHYLLRKLGQPDVNNVLAISNAEQVGMMVRGEIDAAWAPEPWGARLVAEAEGHIIGEEKDLWPDKEFTLAAIVTTPEFLAARPDVIRKLLTVHIAWTKRLATEPDRHLPQLSAALLALTGKKLPKGVLPAAIRRTRFTDEPLEATFRTFGQWSYEVGYSKQAPDLAGLIDTTLLRSVQGSRP